MQGLRKHLTTILVAFVTATVAAGSTAAIAGIINAKRLDGFTANQLVRIANATATTGDSPLPGPDTLLTSSIGAPHKGVLLISTSAQLDDSSGANQGTVDCWISLDGKKLSLSKRSVDFWPATTGLTHEPCATTIAVPVGAGLHHVNVMGDNPDDLNIFFTTRTLTVLYEPFNGAGGLG
jgi:hypothetical protein